MFTMLHGYYKFLTLGKFMEQMVITNDLSELALDLPIKTWEKSHFLLKEGMIKKLLVDISHHPDKRNVFWYLLEISAFKGIFSVMRELIENDAVFRDALKDLLKGQYFPFEQVVRFLRNVLNHATTSGISLKLDDYEIQRDFILSPKIQKLHQLKNAMIQLDFRYADYIAEWKGSASYGVKLTLDFDRLKPGIGLEKLISWHDMYLLSELCFNLSQIIEHGASQKKQLKKTLPQKSFAKKYSFQKKEKSLTKTPRSPQRSWLPIKKSLQKAPLLKEEQAPIAVQARGEQKKSASSWVKKKLFSKKTSQVTSSQAPAQKRESITSQKSVSPASKTAAPISKKQPLFKKPSQTSSSSQQRTSSQKKVQSVTQNIPSQKKVPPPSVAPKKSPLSEKKPHIFKKNIPSTWESSALTPAKTSATWDKKQFSSAGNPQNSQKKAHSVQKRRYYPKADTTRTSKDS